MPKRIFVLLILMALIIIGAILVSRPDPTKIEAERILACPGNPAAHFADEDATTFWECPRDGTFRGRADIETYSRPLYARQILFAHASSKAVCDEIYKLLPSTALGYQGCDFAGVDPVDGAKALMARYGPLH